MKRIITLVLSLIFILQGISVAAAVPANDYARLENFGFIPEGFETKDMSAAATREDLAFMMAKLMKVGDMSPIKTKFEDVEETSVYSGYINILNKAGVISGESATRFNPKGSFTLATADRLVVKVLGYTGIAQDEEQCVNLATRLQMNKNVEVLDNKAVTNGGLVQFIHNVIEADLPKVSFNDAESTVPVYSITNDRSVLGTWLGISAYYGTVDEVNDSAHEAVVTITKNKYEANSKMLAAGSVHTFKGASNLNLNKFLNVPSILWVDKNGVIIAMEYDLNVEVKYGYVYSVNGDDNAAHTYSGAYVNEIMLNDDNTIYKADAGMEFFYNFKEYSGAVKIIGNFAKVILKNNKIIGMEMWDLKEGGLVTSAVGGEIVYTQGAITGKVLSSFDEAEKRVVYIDGKIADIGDLRTESVFSYYSDSENAVIVASHVKITDVLKSYRSNQLQIGSILYNINTPFYYTTDGKAFSKGTNPSALLNSVVSAYIHPSGGCMYLEPADPSSIKTNKRIGILVGQKQATFGDEQVNILLLEPTIEKKIVTVSENLRVVDAYGYKDLNGNFPRSLYTELGGVSNNADAWAAIKAASFPYNQNAPFVLEFDIRDDKLIEVSKPLHYYGLKDIMSIPNFLNHNVPTDVRIMYTAAYGAEYAEGLGRDQEIYMRDTPFVFLLEKDGMVEAKIIPWGELYNSTADGVKFMPFGYEGNSDFRLALFCGNTADVTRNEVQAGIVMGKGLSLDAEGEACGNLTVITSSGAETMYKVTIEEANALPEYAYIEYTVGGVTKESDEITIKPGSTIDLSMDEIVEDPSKNMYVGTVSRIDDMRIGFDNNEDRIYFMKRISGKTSFFERISNHRGVTFKSIERSDVRIGDKMAFYKTTQGILIAIVTERAE